MNALLAAMNQMAASGLAALLNTLWYAGAVVGLTWIILRCLPRVNAATRYWIWTGVLAFLIVVPFLPGMASRVRTAFAARAESTVASQPLARISPAASAPELAPIKLTLSTAPGSYPWPLWLLAAWIVAAAWQLARLSRGVALVRRLKACAEVAPIDALPLSLLRERGKKPLTRLATLATLSPWEREKNPYRNPSPLPGGEGARGTRAGEGLVRCSPGSVESDDPLGRRAVCVLTSAGLASPVAVGYLRPAVILPVEWLAWLEGDEKQNVLLHELAHLARYDDWMALVTHAMDAVLVFHPLAAIVLRQIEREREMACDDFVVARTGSARSYARSLARLHDLRWSAGTRLLAPGLLGRHSSLGSRIESLLRRGRKFSARPSLASLGVSALLLAVLLGAGGLIPNWIAIAQTSSGLSDAVCADLPKSFCANLPNSFEVASIKPSGVSGHGTRWDTSMGRLSASNVPVSAVIERAYGIMPQQLGVVPASIRSRRYTIQAEAPPELAHDVKIARQLPPDLREQAVAAIHQSWRQMLQSLLAERFKLQVHRETKQLPVYELVVVKDGPKLKPTNSADFIAAHRKPGGTSGHTWPGHFDALGASMDYFANGLSQWESAELGRMIINKTGLTGSYDFNLTWTPWRGGMRRAGSGQTTSFAAVDSSGPSIFTAIQQQLGLKLKSAKGPVEVLVIDHIEPPTPN